MATTSLSRSVITIDGLAGTGKSALARELSKKLGYQHLNTGILYRALAFLLLRSETFRACSTIDDRKRTVSDLLVHTSLRLDKDESADPIIQLSSTETLHLNQLQSDEISSAASQIAEFEVVRDFLLPIQQKAYPFDSLVAEGRDMGTVVFPDAHRKFFVEVPLDLRVERRFQQLSEGGQQLGGNIEEAKKKIKSDILERDHRDQNRTLAPCIPAQGAIIYANTATSLTQAVDELYHLATR